MSLYKRIEKIKNPEIHKHLFLLKIRNPKGGMLLFTLPILSGAFLMVLADLHSNTLFFDPIFGGDPIFYQHFHFLDGFYYYILSPSSCSIIIWFYSLEGWNFYGINLS